jgi:RNA polymerase sigma-70 factor (family 1)
MPESEKDIIVYELQRRMAVYEDEPAYRELFFHLYSPLKRFAYGFLKSNELAEETVSDIFIEIWRRRRELMDINDLKVYMYISVKHAALKKLQELNKNKVVSIDDFSADFPSTYSTPEEAILTSELVQKIQLAINQLPPRCKLVYKLAKEDKLQYKEIAEILNISVKTIDNQLATALKKIAAAINFRLEKDKIA